MYTITEYLEQLQTSVFNINIRSRSSDRLPLIREPIYEIYHHRQWRRRHRSGTDPANGDPEQGIPRNMPFENFPKDWLWPLCSLGKEYFIKA
jgi:rubredoxin